MIARRGKGQQPGLIRRRAVKIVVNIAKPELHNDINFYYATLLQAVDSPSFTDEEIFHLILSFALELTGSEQGALSTIDTSRERETIFTMTSGTTEVVQISTRFAATASQQKPLLANTAQPDLVWPGIRQPVSNFLVVPASFDGNMVGRIAVANSARDYSEADLTLVERLGKILAMVMQNRMRDSALQRRAEELAEKHREIKSFTDMVAHDFRTPMVNIKGFAKELNCSVTELQQMVFKVRDVVSGEVQADLDRIIDKEIPEALNYINAAIARMDKMVVGMLELARLGQRKLLAEATDLNKIVGAVVASFSHHIEQRGIKLEIDKLPEIYTDRLAVEQIFGNLIDNAIKFLDPARPGEIKIAYRDGGKDVIIDIRDNGRGIAPENQPKVFSLYWRESTQEPGDGMGLAYIATLIARLGGTITCQSKLGEGTEMILTLPKASQN
jgi:signal transduction histidine kinase